MVLFWVKVSPFLSLAWWLWCIFFTYAIYTKKSKGSGDNGHRIMDSEYSSRKSQGEIREFCLHEMQGALLHHQCCFRFDTGVNVFFSGTNSKHKTFL